MNPRFRMLAALLALFALSAYFAESMWASLCPPAVTVSDTAAEGVAPTGHAGMHHAPASSPEEPAPAGADPIPCPLGIPGPGNSCIGLSLPAPAAEVQAVPIVDEGAVRLLEDRPDLLLAAALFHPPRA